MEIIVGFLAVAFLVYIFIIWWKIFDKAGEAGWKIFIPFYNIYIMGKIARDSTFGLIYLFVICLGGFVPIVGFIITLCVGIYWAFELGERFNKSTGFKIALCIPLVCFFALWDLAFNESCVYKIKKQNLIY